MNYINKSANFSNYVLKFNKIRIEKSMIFQNAPMVESASLLKTSILIDSIRCSSATRCLEIRQRIRADLFHTFLAIYMTLIG